MISKKNIFAIGVAFAIGGAISIIAYLFINDLIMKLHAKNTTTRIMTIYYRLKEEPSLQLESGPVTEKVIHGFSKHYMVDGWGHPIYIFVEKNSESIQYIVIAYGPLWDWYDHPKDFILTQMSAQSAFVYSGDQWVKLPRWSR